MHSKPKHPYIESYGAKVKVMQQRRKAKITLPDEPSAAYCDIETEQVLEGFFSECFLRARLQGEMGTSTKRHYHGMAAIFCRGLQFQKNKFHWNYVIISRATNEVLCFLFFRNDEHLY